MQFSACKRWARFSWSESFLMASICTFIRPSKPLWLVKMAPGTSTLVNHDGILSTRWWGDHFQWRPVSFHLLMIPCIRHYARFIRRPFCLWFERWQKIFFWVTTQWPRISYWLANHGRAVRKRYCRQLRTHGPESNPYRELRLAKTHGRYGSRAFCLSTS